MVAGGGGRVVAVVVTGGRVVVVTVLQRQSGSPKNTVSKFNGPHTATQPQGLLLGFECNQLSGGVKQISLGTEPGAGSGQQTT